MKAAGVALLALVLVGPVRGEPVAMPGWRVETVVEPSWFHGVHGMAVAPDGDVYAGDIIGQTVWKIPSGTATPEPFVPEPRGMADDVAIAPDGTIAWTSILTGVVYARARDGTIRPWASDLPGINAVGFTKSGRLFASQLEGANRLFEIYPDNRAPPRLVLADNGGLNGFQFDAQGRMVAPQGLLKRVIRFDIASRAIEVLADGFVWPTGVKLGHDGLPYVVDLTAGTLSRIEKDGHVERIAQLPLGIDNLAIDLDGSVLVSSPANNSIYRVDPRTRAVAPWIAGRLSVPGGIAITHGGRVLIGDTFGFKEYVPDQHVLHDLGTQPGGTMTTAINVRACGDRVTLAHWYTGQLHVLAADDLRVLGVVKGLSKPQDAVAFDNGDVLAAEAGAHRLVRIAAAGGARTPILTDLDIPTGLTCPDRKGRVALTDAGRGTVLEWDPREPKPRVLASALLRPEGIGRGPDGRLYVVEVGARRVVRLESNGTSTPIATDLPPPLDPPPGVERPWIVTGLDVGSDGTVYVGSPRSTALYAIHPVPRRIQ